MGLLHSYIYVYNNIFSCINNCGFEGIHCATENVATGDPVTATGGRSTDARRNARETATEGRDDALSASGHPRQADQQCACGS